MRVLPSAANPTRQTVAKFAIATSSNQAGQHVITSSG
eukprot:COSAG01_NODE_72929_length_251_cov_1.677632_1_plen_36_part_10